MSFSPFTTLHRNIRDFIYFVLRRKKSTRTIESCCSLSGLTIYIDYSDCSDYSDESALLRTIEGGNSSPFFVFLVTV